MLELNYQSFPEILRRSVKWFVNRVSKSTRLRLKLFTGLPLMLSFDFSCSEEHKRQEMLSLKKGECRAPYKTSIGNVRSTHVLLLPIQLFAGAPVRYDS